MAKNTRSLWTMVYLVQLGGTFRNSEPDDLMSSCKHVLWLLQGVVLNISISVSVIMLGVCQCGRYLISLEENGGGGSSLTQWLSNQCSSSSIYSDMYKLYAGKVTSHKLSSISIYTRTFSALLSASLRCEIEKIAVWGSNWGHQSASLCS